MVLYVVGVWVVFKLLFAEASIDYNIVFVANATAVWVGRDVVDVFISDVVLFVFVWYMGDGVSDWVGFIVVVLWECMYREVFDVLRIYVDMYVSCEAFIYFMENSEVWVNVVVFVVNDLCLLSVFSELLKRFGFDEYDVEIMFFMLILLVSFFK